MKLYVVRVFVDDWDRACEFYEKKLKLPLTFKDSTLGWAQFGEPGLGIERVDENDEEGRSLVGRFLGVSLQVDDIEAKYQELIEQGVEFTGPPERQPWGGSLAHFKDSAGNTLTLLG